MCLVSLNAWQQNRQEVTGSKHTKTLAVGLPLDLSVIFIFFFIFFSVTSKSSAQDIYVLFLYPKKIIKNP